jgi:hypothetical protein
MNVKALFLRLWAYSSAHSKGKGFMRAHVIAKGKIFFARVSFARVKHTVRIFLIVTFGKGKLWHDRSVLNPQRA